MLTGSVKLAAATMTHCLVFCTFCVCACGAHRAHGSVGIPARERGRSTLPYGAATPPPPTSMLLTRLLCSVYAVRWFVWPHPFRHKARGRDAHGTGRVRGMQQPQVRQGLLSHGDVRGHRRRLHLRAAASMRRRRVRTCAPVHRRSLTPPRASARTRFRLLQKMRGLAWGAFRRATSGH